MVDRDRGIPRVLLYLLIGLCLLKGANLFENPAFPRGRGHETAHRLDRLAHGKDIEIGSEEGGLDEGSIERIVGVESDVTT